MPPFQFNSQGIDPHYGGMAGLPVGKHPVVIVASQLKPTKDGQGGYMELTLQAIDGPAKGLTTIDRLNLHNKSPQAVEIANKQLSAYCHVTGSYAFNATEELHNKPFVVEMKARNDNPNQTEVAALFDMNGNEPGKAGAGAQGGGQGGFGGGQPAAAPATGAAPAWGATGGGQAAQGDQGAQGGAGGGQGWQQGGGAAAAGAGAPWGGR